jgi:hypothetical protein
VCLFSVYSWIAATSTAAMGSKWRPIEIALPAMIREERLGRA